MHQEYDQRQGDSIDSCAECGYERPCVWLGYEVKWEMYPRPFCAGCLRRATAILRRQARHGQPKKHGGGKVMHIHNVADYAPKGGKLLRTDYEAGATRHVFADAEGAELVCEVEASSADEERAALEAFKAKHG